MLEVFGRETELDVLRHFVRRIPEGPCALALEGEAGIGKTTLWEAGVGYVREQGLQLLTCRSAQSEAELSYGGLGDVLAELPQEALETLPDVQRHALEVALLRAEPGAAPVDHRTVAAGTLGALLWFAWAGPVAVALDDPQWMDGPSRQALAYAIRRLDDEPIGVLTAVRVGEEVDDPLELRRAFSDERRGRLEVRPLPIEALGRLLRRRLGWVPFGSALFELHTISGGNPFFALEIARASMEDRESLIVPRSLRSQVSDRLATLPTTTRKALVVAAALQRPTVGMVERVIDEDGDALRPAVVGGVLELEGGMVRFTHPLFASVAYADAMGQERARIHRQVSELVEDPEERAHHLALCVDPPDAGVAGALEEAADRTRSRGAPVAAAELCLEALNFTPEDRVDDQRRRVLLAADSLFEAGETPRVVALLEGALAVSPDGPARAAVLWRLGRAGWWGGAGRREMVEFWLDEAEEDANGDPWLGWAVHRTRFWIARERGRYAALPEHARLALGMARLADDPVATAVSLGLVAFAEAICGRGVVEDAIRGALEVAEPAARASAAPAIEMDDHPGYPCGEALLRTDHLDEARTALERLRREASDRGAEGVLSVALCLLCEIELLAGNWDLASRHADEACRLGVIEALEATMRGSVAAHVGRVDEARRDLVRALGLLPSDRDWTIDTLLVCLPEIGFLELSLGNLAEAHRHLSRATGLFMDSGVLEPGFGRFLPDAIEALVGLGELGEAERLTDWLEERGRALDRVWALATSARCRGLLLAAKGDHETALQHLERAMGEHDRLPMPFERARTLLVRGTILRRAKRKRSARESLQEGLEILERLGARVWAERARAELSSIGGRAPRAGTLTPTEERVARLAAAGRTNREIADALFLSVRTVEGHLSHVYAKLGLRSRTELALHLDSTEVAT